MHFPDNTFSTINIIKINAFQSKILHFTFCFKTYNYHRMLVLIFSIEVVRSHDEIICFQLERFVFKYSTRKFCIILTDITPNYKYVEWNPTDVCLENITRLKEVKVAGVEFLKIKAAIPSFITEIFEFL